MKDLLKEDLSEKVPTSDIFVIPLISVLTLIFILSAAELFDVAA